MTPRDRLLCTLRGGRADRVPLVLEGFHFRTREQIDAHPDPARRQIAHRVFDQTHALVSFPSHVNRYLVTPPQRIRQVDRQEAHGMLTVTSEIDTPRGPLTAVTQQNVQTQTVWTTKYPCETREEIEKIRSIPWELPTGVMPPDLSRVSSDHARRGIAHTGVSSPFVCVAGMMPYEMFLELCATDLGLMEELTALCLERILAVLDVLLDGSRIEYVWIGGCEWLTPPMASLRVYDALVQPFEAAIIRRVHEAGALCHVHCHGNVRSTLERVIERGGDFFEPVEPPPDGDIPFADAKALAAGRMTLGGNVEARILECEDAAATEAAARRAFEGGKERMVFQTSAGPVSRISSQTLANYHRMVDVWEKLSEC